MKYFLPGVFALGFALCINARAAADSESKDYWFEGRLGLALDSSEEDSIDGLVVGTQLNYGKDGRVYSLGASVYLDCIILCSNDDNADGTELYAAFGVRRFHDWYHAKAQIGLGLVTLRSLQSNCDFDCSRRPRTTIGIPIDLSATVGRYGGLGLNLHLNLNGIKTVVSLNFTISLGNFN